MTNLKCVKSVQIYFSMYSMFTNFCFVIILWGKSIGRRYFFKSSWLSHKTVDTWQWFSSSTFFGPKQSCCFYGWLGLYTLPSSKIFITNFICRYVFAGRLIFAQRRKMRVVQCQKYLDDQSFLILTDTFLAWKWPKQLKLIFKITNYGFNCKYPSQLISLDTMP